MIPSLQIQIWKFSVNSWQTVVMFSYRIGHQQLIGMRTGSSTRLLPPTAFVPSSISKKFTFLIEKDSTKSSFVGKLLQYKIVIGKPLPLLQGFASFITALQTKEKTIK